MKSNAIAKSSFTLPADEVPLVLKLKKRLKLKSNTEVIRKALRALNEQLDRRALKERFAEASRIVAEANSEDYRELDLLSGEGVE